MISEPAPISFDRLRLHSFLRDREIENRVWFLLDLGAALTLGNLYVDFQPDGKFSWNEALADFRFLDIQFQHRNETNPPPLLEMIIAQAVARQLPELRVVVQKEDAGLEMISWQPWNGQSLTIPMEFLYLFGFRCGGRGVSANVQLGHHLVLFGLRLFNGEEVAIDQQRVRDERIAAAIFGNQELVSEIRGLPASRKIVFDAAFLFAKEGCDPDGVPPPVRFM